MKYRMLSCIVLKYYAREDRVIYPNMSHLRGWTYAAKPNDIVIEINLRNFLKWTTYFFFEYIIINKTIEIA